MSRLAIRAFTLVAFLSVAGFAPTASASWLVRLLTTPPDLLNAMLGLETYETEDGGQQLARIQPASFQNPRTRGSADGGSADRGSINGGSINGGSINGRSVNARNPQRQKPAGRKLPGQVVGQVASLAIAVPDSEQSILDDYHVWGYTQPDILLVEPVSRGHLAQKVTIPEGGSFDGTLASFGITSEDRKAIRAKLLNNYDVRKLPAGTRMDIVLDSSIPARQNGRLLYLYAKPNGLTTLRLSANADGSFRSTSHSKKLKKRWILAEGKIRDGSLWSDGKRAKMPSRIIANLTRAYRHSGNLDRSMIKGDSFEVLYEATVDDDGRVYKSGELLFATVTVKGKRRTIYWFEKGKKAGFFSSNGTATKKGRALSRKPLKTGRLTSYYGMRRHPVLRKRKMHWGIDYGAKTGTPVYAAGDGVIIYRARKGGFGNFVQIDHGGGYKTSYAHLNRFSKKRKGSRVRQGQVIGYVGSTGRSTGPHLHYEVSRYNKRVNPLKLKIPPSNQLYGSNLTAFKKEKARIDRLRKSALPGKLAKLQ